MELGIPRYFTDGDRPSQNLGWFRWVAAETRSPTPEEYHADRFAQKLNP
jgi:hypothetical protein